MAGYHCHFYYDLLSRSNEYRSVAVHLKCFRADRMRVGILALSLCMLHPPEAVNGKCLK